MSLPIQADPIPLHTDADGVVRVGGTRVTLDTVISVFKQGCSPEEIVDRYDSLALADVHAVITYYLLHREAVEHYLEAREQRAREIRKQNEARWNPDGIKERLLARRAARERP